jgi:hypothetical protein
MIDSKMIDKALLAHKEWKIRLESAIQTGQSDFNPVVVKTDNACEFGKWLYGLSSVDKSAMDFKTIKDLHAEFHKIAGDILQLAVSGQREEALKKLSFGGFYGVASSNLSTALYEWKKRLLV